MLIRLFLPAIVLLTLKLHAQVQVTAFPSSSVDTIYRVSKTINDGRQLWKISLPESTANEITCSDNGYSHSSKSDAA